MMPASARVALFRVGIAVTCMAVWMPGCSAGRVDDAADESTEPSVEAGAGAEDDATPERGRIDLGLLPLIDVAPVHIALEDGLFEREGLRIEIVPVQGGAAAIPAMVAGELDIAFGAVPSTLSGSANGLDLRLIAEQNRASAGFSDISALPVSGLEGDLRALEDARLGLNTFANVAELTTREIIEDAGGNFNRIEAVEVPFPEMIPMLERGELDAAFLVEPFTTIARQMLDARSVADPYTGQTEALPVAGYTTTENFAANFPNTVRAFQRAIIVATDIAREDPQRVVDILPTYTTLSEEAAAAVTQPEFVARIDQREIQRVVDLMVKHGFLDEPLDLDTLIVPTPQG